jgi:hypothetical protein
VSKGLKFIPKLDKIVYLPIEDDLECGILVRNRLCATLEIYDAQSPMSQANFTVHKNARAVWATMPDRRRHLGQQIRGDWITAQVKNSTNSTHDL